MVIQMTKIFALCVVALTLVACNTTTPEQSGQKMSISDLEKNPGYSWYQTEVATYTPNTAMVDSVRSNFDATEQKICIFVKPSCGCRGTQRLFPRVMKTLLDANIDMSKVEVWSMRSPSDNTPYKTTLALTSLPTIVVMRNGVEDARIIDADFNEVNADTLIAQAVTE